ncbi:MAG: LCP family protein [Clostridiales bacterium]|nr:LCP family protein [Clostridiales bacterium]
MFYDRPEKRRGAGNASGSKPKKQAKARPSLQAPSRPAERKNQKEGSRKRHLLLKFLALVLVLALLAGGGLYILPVGTFGSHTAYGALQTLPGGYTHILLIGLDLDGNGTSRSDTMMILSIGSGGIKLTSLQRDTGVAIEGRKGLNRLNAAYAYGGEEGLLRTINQNFGFDLSRWAEVDYESFPVIIDALGGVRIDGVSDAEAEQINSNMLSWLWMQYKAGRIGEDEARKRYFQNELKQGGDYTLSGMQALAYARIRKTDSDYGRTNRQRKLISACVSKLKAFDPVTLIRFIKAVLGSAKTNMTTLEMLSLGEKALFASGVSQTRLPVNGSYRDDGGMFYDVDYKMNRDYFISFVYSKS